MSTHITGKLITVGNYTEEEQIDRDNPLARAVVVMPREALKAVCSLPMYEDVLIVKAEEWDQLERENAALKAWKGSALLRELECENAALKNELARLNGQTQWQCTCGGTDCAGQRENAALREDKARLDSGTILLTVGGERVHHVGVNLRAAIEAGRKEAQP